MHMNDELISDATGNLSVRVSETGHDGAISMYFIDKLYHSSTGTALYTNSYLNWDWYGVEKLSLHSELAINDMISWDTSAMITYVEDAYQYLVKDYTTGLLATGAIHYYLDSMNWYVALSYYQSAILALCKLTVFYACIGAYRSWTHWCT